MQNPEFVTQHWGLFHTQAACPQAFIAFRLNWVISGRLGGGGWGGGGYSWTKDKSIVTRTAFHSYKCVTSLSSGFLTSLTSQERKNKSCSECECVCACVCGLSTGIQGTGKEVRGYGIEWKDKIKTFQLSLHWCLKPFCSIRSNHRKLLYW